MLKGQIALVTGASRGIGRAIALELGREGATVIGTATTEAGAADIQKALDCRPCPGLGRRAECHRGGSLRMR
jgi:3-oxoacyl-[acyl-carrier protein] reductase